MKISVIIPVYNEERYIRTCLESILAGDRKPDELIVADGGSTDRTAEIARSLGATVVDNPGRTAASGRNVGALHSHGSILAFTDGDCYAAPGWLAGIEKAFDETGADAVGGRILGAETDNDVERYWNNLQLNVVMQFGGEKMILKKHDFRHSLITANCAYSRKIFWKVKGFNRWFANNGEDVDLMWRAQDAGAKMVYTPDAVIYFHGVTDIRGIRKKSFRNGVSSSKIQKVYGTKVNFDPVIYRVWADALKGTVRGEKWARYNLIETSWHLLGKYWGSIQAGVINV